MHIMNFQIIFSRILKIFSLLLFPTKSSSLVAQRLKCLPPMWETQVWSLGREDPLEKEMATHSSILAWRIPWTEEPDRLQSTGSQRIGHDWATSLSLSSPNYDSRGDQGTLLKEASLWYETESYIHWKLRLVSIFHKLPNALRHRNIKVTAKADRDPPVLWK